MELLLNLAWLLLALPAYWLWRDSRGVRKSRRFASAQCLLTLGCTLVVLFPVISATDDLRAMRTEMEESPSNKHNVRQASGDGPSTSKWQSQPYLAINLNSGFAIQEDWRHAEVVQGPTPAAPVVERAGRSPPICLI
jgi:hypothetical protein